jgi:hypothetical protein
MAQSASTPVTWRALLLTLLSLVLVISALAAGVTWWVWHTYAARVQLRDQSARIVMPRQLSVRADVRNMVAVRLDHDLPVQVPIKQTLSIPMRDPINLNVKVDTVVPIDLDVPVDQVIRVNQTIRLDTSVKTKILGFSVTVPIVGDVPLKADVPVKLSIPVHQRLPVSLTLPAQVQLSGPLPVKIDTVIKTVVPIHESLRLPVTAPVSATLHFPQQEVTAGLRFIDVVMPLSSLRFSPHVLGADAMRVQP